MSSLAAVSAAVSAWVMAGVISQSMGVGVNVPDGVPWSKVGVSEPVEDVVAEPNGRGAVHDRVFAHDASTTVVVDYELARLVYPSVS